MHIGLQAASEWCSKCLCTAYMLCLLFPETLQNSSDAAYDLRATHLLSNLHFASEALGRDGRADISVAGTRDSAVPQV